MMQFDDDGRVAWVRRGVQWRPFVIFGGFSILGLPDGSFIVAGWEYVERIGGDFDAVLARVDSEGQVAE